MSVTKELYVFIYSSSLVYYFSICLFIFFIYLRGEGKKAAECLRTALKEYNLKFGTILNDPDLASFRALPEFKELQEEVCFQLWI